LPFFLHLVFEGTGLYPARQNPKEILRCHQPGSFRLQRIKKDVIFLDFLVANAGAALLFFT
jgi:hypothetical protein